jgi:hypothetical protein
MAIELSNITFTEQDDIVPASGVEEIVNTGIANTLAGNDVITGTSNGGFGIYGSSGTINTGDGNDIIAGTSFSTITAIFLSGTCGIDTGKGDDIITGTGFGHGIAHDSATFLNTGEGNDIITGNSKREGTAIISFGPIDTGDGNDTIMGTSGILDNVNSSLDPFYQGIVNGVSINTGDGDDRITGIARNAEIWSFGITNDGTLDTGNGGDIITGTGSNYGILNQGTINTGNSKDFLISHGRFFNLGGVFLGDGNDSIIVDTDLYNYVINSYNNAMETGDGNDIITSTGIIYNEGIIETGNGDDSIIVGGGVDDNGTRYGIYNNGGAINMGDGNDSIIANEGFQSGPNSSGAWFLGEGDDYIKGFGNGDFYGGNGNDTLELTPGTYTVGIWGEGGESSIFTKGNQLMITSEFEKLKAGSTIYDFTSLTAGQIIVVA